AGLRHVGPAAATFAAEHIRGFADEIDGIKSRGEIIGDADDDAGFAIRRHADDGDHARTKLFLAVVGKAAQVFEVDPFDRARDKFYVTDRAYPVRAFASFAGARAARQSKLLLCLGQIALKALALFDKRAYARRQVLKPHAPLRCF